MIRFKVLVVCLSIGFILNSTTGFAADRMKPIEHWLLLDASASLKSSDIQRRNEAAINKSATLLRADPKNIVGVAAFGCGIVGTPLSPSKEANQISRYISTIQNNAQCTDIESALNLVLEASTKTRSPLVAYLFTDGRIDLPPELSISSSRDGKDLASEQRIRSKLIPEMVKKGIPVHVIAMLSKSLDKEAVQLLEDLAYSTSAQYQNARADELLGKLAIAHRKGLHAAIHEGGYIYLDPQFADRHDLIVPRGAKVDSRGNIEIREKMFRDGKRLEVEVTSEKGRIQIVDPSGTGVQPRDVTIYSMSKMSAEPYSPPLSKIHFYQNEVIPFKIKLLPKLGTSSKEIYEIIQSKINMLVKITGSCQDVVRLKKNDKDVGQGEDRGVFFEEDWWITRCPESGRLGYEFVMQDQSSVQNYYELKMPSIFQGYSLVALPPELGQWDIKNTAGDDQVFKNMDKDTFFTGGQLQVAFKYSFANMPSASPDNRLLPWNPSDAAYFLDDKKIDINPFHLSEKDIGERTLTCVYNAMEAASLNTVTLKFQKKIHIENGPFIIRPVKQKTGFVPSTKEIIEIPFVADVKEDIILGVNFESNLPLSINDDSKYIQLRKGKDQQFFITFHAANSLPSGKHHITMRFQNSDIMKKSLEYEFPVTVYPFWGLVLSIIAVMTLIIYLCWVCYWTLWWNYKTADKRENPWASKLKVGNKEKFFQLTWFLPGRQITMKNKKNEPVYKIKATLGGGIAIKPTNKLYASLIETKDETSGVANLKSVHLSDSISRNRKPIRFVVRLNPKGNRELQALAQTDRFLNVTR
jgi:hypothetical protein